MPSLIAPTSDLRVAWAEAHAEWGPGYHEDGFGLTPADDVGSTAGFAAWMSRLDGRADLTTTVEDGRHTCTYWWIVDDGRVLGGMALRQGDDEYTRWAGHLGFGIRPSARRRGLASWGVREVLVRARERGIERVSAVCDAHNLASAMTMERCGGVPEGIRYTDHGPVRRFWFSTRPLTR